MRLNQLLKHLTYEHVQGSQSREITDICYHSGNVREGSLFAVSYTHLTLPTMEAV